MTSSKDTADKRIERSKAKVLSETHRQLVRNGVNGVSIDEISRISGVSKATIYRHWPSRSALLMEACARLGKGLVAPDTKNVREDLLALMGELADQLQTANWSSVYPSIIDAAERDPQIKSMQIAMHKGFMAPVQSVLERAKAKGELSDSPTSELVAALVGPLFFRRWFSKEKLDKRFVKNIVDAAISRR